MLPASKQGCFPPDPAIKHSVRSFELYGEAFFSISTVSFFSEQSKTSSKHLEDLQCRPWIHQVFVCFCCYLIMENGRQRIPLGSLSSSSARSGRKRISLAALSPSSARTGSNIAHWYLVKPLTEVMTQDFNSGTITASVGGSQGYLTPSQRRLHGEDLSVSSLHHLKKCSEDFGNSIPDTVRVCQCIREAGLPAKFLLLRLLLDEALL
ncbi:hypothetical protein ACET3Z_013223 [Daucus carota]